jgi:hypothetical protein
MHREGIPRNVEVAILNLAVALFPIYVFPSGGLQPTHLVFLLLAVVSLYRYGLPEGGWVPVLIVLSGYSLLVEGIYGSFAPYADWSYVATPGFLFFNFLLSVGVFQVVVRRKKHALWPGVCVAAAFALVSIYVGGVDLTEIGEEGRSTGTFNNPNQLGYFSACLLSLSYLLYREREIGFTVMLGLFAASLFLAVVSLSKAAIIANALVVIFALRPRAKGYGGAIWLGLAIAILGGVAYLAVTGRLDDFVFYDRILNMSNEQDSSLQERGYFAFLNGNAAQIMFGMGNAEVLWLIGHEVHSTFASIMNSYGILGLSLFLSIFVLWARRIYEAYGVASVVVVLGPATLYGISHNGTRFSIFWLLFSASMGMAERQLRAGGGQHVTS